MKRSFTSLSLPAALALSGLILAPAARAQESPSSNPYLGGVPSGETPSGTLRLTLRDAVDRALRQNLGGVLAREASRAAEGNRQLDRADLMPSLYAGLTAAREEINLEAYGFPVPAGQSPVVGPFNVADARLYLAQPILDLAAIQRARSGAAHRDAAVEAERDARELVMLSCAGLYFQAAIGASRIDAVRAQAAAAEALYDHARRLNESGVVPGIEVIRAKVQLASQRQRVIVAENDFDKEKLALARALGIPLSQPVELAEKLPFKEVAPPSPEEALARAMATRPDLRQAEDDVLAAEAKLRADRDDYLPTIRFQADVGWIGPTEARLERTFTVGAGLRIPIFEAGKPHARNLRDDAAAVQARARRDDLRARVEYEVRAAILDLRAADERVRVAREGLDLAKEQLRQSQDRFVAGVAGNLEVVQAQDALAIASDNWLSSLYAHNQARLLLARAVGAIEASLDSFLAADEDKSHG